MATSEAFPTRKHRVKVLGSKGISWRDLELPDIDEAALGQVDAILATRLPLDIPPYRLRARPATPIDDEPFETAAGALSISPPGRLRFHGTLRAPRHDTGEPEDKDITISLADLQRFAHLTPARLGALVGGWLSAVEIALRSSSRVPHEDRGRVDEYTLSPSTPESLARVSDEALVKEFLRPDRLGRILRLDPSRANEVVATVSRVLAEVLPVAGAGIRMELAPAGDAEGDPPVHATASGVFAHLCLIDDAGDVRSANVMIVPAHAADDLDRIGAAIRAQAAVLGELFTISPQRHPLATLMPHELFAVAELLDDAAATTFAELEAIRRAQWRGMFAPARKPRGTTSKTKATAKRKAKPTSKTKAKPTAKTKAKPTAKSKTKRKRR